MHGQTDRLLVQDWTLPRGAYCCVDSQLKPVLPSCCRRLQCRCKTAGANRRCSSARFFASCCIRLGDVPTKRAAFEALPKVCRTASALFDFVAYCKAINQVRRSFGADI